MSDEERKRIEAKIGKAAHTLMERAHAAAASMQIHQRAIDEQVGVDQMFAAASASRQAQKAAHEELDKYLNLLLKPE